MINSVIIVGRLTEDPILRKLENGSTVCTLKLAVVRNFKNYEGEYETDFIKCTLWEGIATSAGEFCKKGSIVGIRGRLAVNKMEVKINEELKKIDVLEVIAERVSFIKI